MEQTDEMWTTCAEALKDQVSEASWRAYLADIRPISADEEAIAKLAANYIDNIKAFTLKEKVRNKYTGHDEEPDERLMRSVEEKIDIPEGRKDDFRREIMNYIGALAIEGRTFDYKTNERLHKALELKLFEDLSSLARAALQALCAGLGVRYLTRARNAHAKAGNLNNGLTQARADLIAKYGEESVRRIAAEGPSAMYEGPIAQAIDNVVETDFAFGVEAAATRSGYTLQ